MALSTKIIKKRIRSIGNTKKITKAMEMVSAAKMRKAVNAVLSSRHYSKTAWQTVMNLVQKIDATHHPLLQPKEKIETAAIILISGNKGLCGGFNSHAVAKALEYSRELKEKGVEKQNWIVMGKKGGESLTRSKKNIELDFVKPDLIEGVADVLDLSKMMIQGYLTGQYDQVSIVYTDFTSPLKQEPMVKQLLPLTQSPDESLGQTAGTKEEKPSADTNEYIFEPDIKKVLNHFLPRLIEVQLYQALLESNASEHSARMMAMKNASESANDMIAELTLIYNQARQASITREIAEISGGKAAIEA
ncbi:MAG: ATP synthase F1 subunit gamma [Candidatus Buchananbacteria bacterium]|nr:ATP synthase F1 subunit gamma [Candidatus Buchananbacteria bacterium]